MITRRLALQTLLAAGFGAAQTSDRKRKPNIIVIVGDDLGYGETSAFGSKDIPTPNIDSIGRNGVRFTDGYVSCPVCSPTRAGLMAGRYQQRFGHEFNPGPAEQAVAEFGLPLTEVTLPSRLKTQGYTTGMFGKWHLGYRPEMHPMKRGFDEFFGFLGGAHSYLDADADKTNPILRGTEPVHEIHYSTDDFTREALSFIDRNQQKPFFLYLPYNSVHNPLQSTEKYLSRFPAIQDTKRKTFAAMLSAMDDGVGRILKSLRDAKLEEDTLVFFISDNGGPTPQTTSGNGPLRGFKGQVWEGGIRVPFQVQWKGKIPAGQVYDKPVISLDISTTALAAAGVSIPPVIKLDGVDLMPYLTGKTSAAPHNALYWRFGPQGAIRMGDWKLVMIGAEPAELYNLTADIGEKTELAAKEPDRVNQLKSAYEEWNSQLEKPRWQTKGQGAGGGGRRRNQQAAKP